MTVRSLLSTLLLVSVSLLAQQPSGEAAAHKTPTRATAAKAAGVDATKEADIRRLLEVTGTRELVEQMKTSMLEQFRQNAPGMPDDMLNELMAELKSDDLVESMIPVYSKHFSGEDIKQLIAFYQSPFGKKVLQEMPQIIAESNDVGIRWGESVVARVAGKWRNQGKISEKAYEQLVGGGAVENEH